MRKHRLSFLVLAIMVATVLLPAMLAPGQAEARRIQGGTWMVYTPNHPNYCAPMPWDCYVINVYP